MQNTANMQRMRRLLLPCFVLVVVAQSTAWSSAAHSKGSESIYSKVLKHMLAKSAGKGIEILSKDKNSSSKAYSDVEFEQELVLLAHELNKQLPEQLDEYTRFDTVTVTSGIVLTSHHTLTAHQRAAVDIRLFSESMKENITISLCDDLATQRLWSHGAVLGYTYNSVDGSFVTSFFIESADCSKESGK